MQRVWSMHSKFFFVSAVRKCEKLRIVYCGLPMYLYIQGALGCDFRQRDPLRLFPHRGFQVPAWKEVVRLIKSASEYKQTLPATAASLPSIS